MTKEEQIITSFRSLVNKMASLNKFKMKDRLHGYQSSEVHCIEYIGKSADANVTKLAQTFYVTRGAISKLTKKLMEKGLIESYQKPSNKKEVYFRLSKQGKEIHKIHMNLHKEFQKRDKVVFAQVTEKQFDAMLRFAEMYSNHLDAEIEKLGIELTSGSDFE